MTVASLAEQGWIGIALLLLLLLKQQIKMLAMRLVFLIYRTPRVDQNTWLLREARQNDKITLARGFWNRSSQRTPKPTSSTRRLSPPRRPEPAAVAELPVDEREPRSSAA